MKLLITGLLSLLLGFILGKQSTLEIASVNRSPLPKTQVAPVAKKPDLFASNTMPAIRRRPFADQDLLAVPLRLIESYWPPPLFDSTSGEFEFASLFSYGLTVEETQNLKLSISAKQKELDKLELENSELVTDAEGNQYFSIHPFPDSGAKVKERLDQEIDKIFSSVSDNRAKLLKLSLARHTVFSGFGANRIEMAIEENNTNGSTKRTFGIKSIQKDGRLVDTKTLPLESPYMAEKFKALVKRHFD